MSFLKYKWQCYVENFIEYECMQCTNDPVKKYIKIRIFNK